MKRVAFREMDGLVVSSATDEFTGKARLESTSDGWF